MTMARCQVCPLTFFIVYVLVLCLLNATPMSDSYTNNSRSKAQPTAHPRQNENEANNGSRGGERDERKERGWNKISAEEVVPEKLENSQVTEFRLKEESSEKVAIEVGSTSVRAATTGPAGKGQGFAGVDHSDLEPPGSSRVFLHTQNDHANDFSLKIHAQSNQSPISPVGLGNNRPRSRKPRDVRRRQSRRHTSERRQASAAVTSDNINRHQHVLVNSLPHSASQIGPMFQPALSPGSANLTGRKQGGSTLLPGQPVSAHFSSFSLFSSGNSLLSNDNRPRRRRQKVRGTLPPGSRLATTPTPPSLEAIQLSAHQPQFKVHRAGQRGRNATEDRSEDIASVLGHSRGSRLAHGAASTVESHQREARLHLREEPDGKVDGSQPRLQDCRRCDLDLRMLRATYKKNLETLKLVLMEAMDRFILDPSQLLTSALCDVLNIPTTRHYRPRSFTSGKDLLHGVSRNPYHRTSLHDDENPRLGVRSPSDRRHQTDRDTPDHEKTNRPSQNVHTSGDSGTSERSGRGSLDGIGKDEVVAARHPTGENTKNPYYRENEQRVRQERVRQYGDFEIDTQDKNRRNSDSVSSVRADHVKSQEHGRPSTDMSLTETTEGYSLPWHTERESVHDQTSSSRRMMGNIPGSNLLVNGVRGAGQGQVNDNQLYSRLPGVSEQRYAGGSLSVLPGSGFSPRVLDVQDTGDAVGVAQNTGGLRSVPGVSLQQANLTQPPASRQTSDSSDKVDGDRSTSQAHSFNSTQYRPTSGPHSSSGERTGTEVVTQYVSGKRMEFPTEVDGRNYSQETSFDDNADKRAVDFDRDEDGGRSKEDHLIDEKQRKEFWERWRQEQQREEKRAGNPESLSCVLGPWTSWAGPVGFGVIERRRSLVGGEEGCMAREGDLVMRVDISVFSDKNPYYKTPEAVGQDFEADFTRSHEPRDLLIVLDASGSIEADDFRLVKEGVELMVDLFCGGFGPNADNNRLAVVVFASDIDVVHRFSDDQSPETLRSAIANMTQPNGNTCTSDALRFAHDVIFAPENGARGDVIHDTLLVTDGHSNCGELSVQEAADMLHTASNVFALGVGLANDTAARWELNSVVSNRDPHHIFSLARFQDFKDMLQSIQDRRNQHSCLPIVADNASSEE